MYVVYNYPWSGKIHSHVCCLWCGTNGPDYYFSSDASSCLGEKCRRERLYGKQPNPLLVMEANERFDKMVREWCLENKIDYEATIENYFKHLGPQDSETKPEPKPEVDYTVYLD